MEVPFFLWMKHWCCVPLIFREDRIFLMMLSILYLALALWTLKWFMISFMHVSYSASMNLHIKQLYGVNNHHIAESSFKAFGKALDMATMYEERLNGSVWSTKGVL